MRYPSWARTPDFPNIPTGSRLDLEVQTSLEYDSVTAGEISKAVCLSPNKKQEDILAGEGYQDVDAAEDKHEMTKQGLLHRNTGLEGEIQEARNAFAALRNEYESTKELLNIRSEELRGVQAFVETGNATSLADVQRVVGHLNAETFQLAASLADSVEYKPSGIGREPSNKGQRAAREIVRDILGPRFIGLLRVVRNDKDPYSVQLALQCVLSDYVTKLSSAWYLECNAAQKEFMQIYEKMKGSGRCQFSNQFQYGKMILKKSTILP